MKLSLLKVVLPALLLSACASSPTVYTDSSPGTNFSQFHTYSWKQEPVDAPPLVKQRIVAAIDAQLQAKGWQRAASSATADVSLAAHVSTQDKKTIDTFYDGPDWSGWGWAPGWNPGWGPGWGGGWGMNTGMSTTTVQNYTVGTLVVDMFDNKTKQAVWRGSARDTIPASPQARDKELEVAITEMFAAFPPKPAGKK